MKDIISQSVGILSDITLNDTGNYNEYEDKDLIHATQVFTYFLMDAIWTTNQELTGKGKLELVETTGKAIRELIKVSTGKDMHKLMKEYLK